MQLILASSSRYRHALLSRLGLAFETHAPDVDEAQRAGETPLQLCRRLSQTKAAAVARMFPDAVVIGSDQVAELAGQIIGKPMSHDQARAQLSKASGRSMSFHTGLCVMHQASGRLQVHVEPTLVRFRLLTQTMIAHYVEREPALDCAGGFKCEGLGISLFEAVGSDDPTALIGLPLIALRRMLASFGIDPLL